MAGGSKASEHAVLVDGADEVLEVHVRAREIVLNAPQLGCHNADTTPTHLQVLVDAAGTSASLRAGPRIWPPIRIGLRNPAAGA